MDPKLKKLQQTWYRKLKKAGFKDIEYQTPDEHLFEYDSFYFKKRYTVDEFVAKQRYYELAGQFAHSHEFPDETDRRIWELHAEGKPMWFIAKAVRRSHKTVERRIGYYSKFIKG